MKYMVSKARFTKEIHRDIEEKQIFCQQNNFNLEAESKKNEADVVRRIIHEMENEFELGFVWDDSLN